MSLDFLSHLNLVTGALLIFALCAGFVLLRGIARMLLGTLVLAASAWLAFWIWQQSPAWSLCMLGKTSDFITTGLPVIAFVVAMIFLRKLLKFIASPFVRPGDRAPSAFTNVPIRLLFALIATAGLWLIGVTFAHHAGSIAEIRDFVGKSASANNASACLQRLKTSVDNALPKEWLKMLDPLAEPARLALAKLIASPTETSLPPVIDPATNKPYPRASIVDDPALQKLVSQQDYSTLLRHPNLTRALGDPKVKKALAEKQK
ncbi:MAG: hypothetical protein WCO57_15215 [Verrucomicrobiota bacterium]